MAQKGTDEHGMERCRALAREVTAAIEELHRVLGWAVPLEDLPGWRELKGRPLVSFDSGGKPWLIATLFGPTGSGKSTLFRLLTGLEVPAGDVIRPVTFNAFVAVPEDLADPARIQELFPFSTVVPLSDFEELKDKNRSRETLFFGRSARPRDAGAEFELVLADVPDFDTIFRRNWEKAEDLMRRAEIVLFTIYPASYMDSAVVRNLEKCCAHAGRLVLIFTKVESAQQAELIWEDLRRKTRCEEELRAFQEVERRDGRKLWQFLEQCDVYYSVHSRSLKLEDILPLGGRAPTFRSLLMGMDGVAVLLASLAEDAHKASATCAELCQKARERAAVLERKIGEAEKHLIDAAAIVAGTCFPAGRMASLILEVMREYRPFWVKVISAPLALLTSAISKSVESLQRVFRGKVKPMPELERERLETVADELLTVWRADLGEPSLTMERCQEARRKLKEHPLPPAAAGWECLVKDSARQWARENRWKTKVLGSINDVLLVLGGAAVGLDLLVAGGQSSIWGSLLLGKLGLIGAAGAGGAAAGALLSFFERLGLRKTLEVADQAWREQRCREVAEHLRGFLARPLFLEKWDRERQNLAEVPLDQYERASVELDELVGAAR